MTLSGQQNIHKIGIIAFPCDDKRQYSKFSSIIITFGYLKIGIKVFQLTVSVSSGTSTGFSHEIQNHPWPKQLTVVSIHSLQNIKQLHLIYCSLKEEMVWRRFSVTELILKYCRNLQSSCL